mmetsp:Transcript_6293/g.11077  ORF Transcript_6293/g.11077 Transcript_6293/m.11077 type:complete len:83 (-) Transcript_6293:74-322(-)
MPHLRIVSYFPTRPSRSAFFSHRSSTRDAWGTLGNNAITCRWQEIHVHEKTRDPLVHRLLIILTVVIILVATFEPTSSSPMR